MEFYISDNEVQEAKKLSNYCIYKVYDVEGSPEIVIVENPFTEENIDKIDMKSTGYFVQFNTK